MEQKEKTYDQLVQEIEELRSQLEEANDTIDAIRTGQVDALIVKGLNGHELYTLKSADQTYRVFIEKMTAGAVTLNNDGIIVYCNSQFGKMVGQPLSQVIGNSFAKYVIQPDRPRYQALVLGGWEKDIKGEIRIAGTEKPIPVQLSITTLELDEGISLSIILADLTAQKETQLLLKVNNEKLRQINNALELSNHDLQQFASVASHDLQEPLRKIQIFSNFLKERFVEELPGDAAQYLEKIISSSNRMKVLIVDILNYSRLSYNDNNFEPTDLNKLVKELMEDYELLIKDKNARITVDKLPTIEVNPGQMRQVFQNILSNALKFSKKHEAPVINISSKAVKDDSVTSTEPSSDIYYSISFKDNGIGFDDQFATNIFTLFRRLHTKDKFEGTGIGLAISKKIIEKHKGLISAKSKEGLGSEFIIVLPASQQFIT